MKNFRISLYYLLIAVFFLTACQNTDTILVTSENILTDEAVTSAEEIETKEVTGEILPITIHICGAVNNPGVYTLEDGCRVIDALKAANGFNEVACQDYINLAQPLTDGCKITIPTEAEVSNLNGQPGSQSDEISIITNPSDGKKDNLVNINTADEQTLLGLTGIGEVRAKSIITYRNEHGPFQTIEDIMKVSGIKQSSYEKFKDEITVN